MRFLITSRKRPELDLENCLGNFEFSVVQKALFSTDGEPFYYVPTKLNYYIILRSLENFISKMILKVLVIDGMAVLNQIHKSNEMKTCKVLNFYCDIVL